LGRISEFMTAGAGGVLRNAYLVSWQFCSQVDFLLQEGYGGAMAWSLEYDDFDGICGTKWPIISSIREQLSGKIRLTVTF
jgi:hypothetical protein